MPLATQDFSVDQGASFTRSIKYINSANNNAFASAITANGQVRQKAFSANALATMNCAFSSANVANDTLTLTLTGDQTQLFNNTLGKVLFYDVKVGYADGSEKFILGGRLLINFTVTR